MDIKIVDENGQVAKESVVAAKEPETVTVRLEDYLLPSIASLFDIKPSEIGEYKEKLKVLLKYARTQTNERTPEAIKWAIRSLQGKIGSPPSGERWINYLHRYITLRMEKEEIEEKIKSFEGG